MTKTNYIWQISEAYLPELQLRLRKSNSNATHQGALGLPKELEQHIKASGIAKGYNDWFTELYSTDRSVLVLPIQGEMSRNGSLFNRGNEFLIRQIIAASEDSDYKAVVLQINTPGGTADSTPELAEAVARLRNEKPVVTHTAYCASAGYYVASQSNEIIIADQAASSIGSIGTLLIYENYKEHLKQEGISMEIIRAKGSEDKARVNWIEELTPEARAYLQNMLDACQIEFAGAVKRGRAGKIRSEDVFTGKMYGANEAIKLGLADSKGSLSDAIKRALALSKSKTK